MHAYYQENPELYFATFLFYLIGGLITLIFWGIYVSNSINDPIEARDAGIVLFWPLFMLRVIGVLVLLLFTNSGRLLHAVVTKPLPAAGRLLKVTAQELFTRRQA